jgi:hypothetical protein
MTMPTDTTWQDAYAAMSARIASHPEFPRLVREVAIAEQTGHPGVSWLRRNSPTFAAWASRGALRVDTGFGRRRARALAEQIARDLDIWPTLPSAEGEARVYGEARDYVQARQRG